MLARTTPRELKKVMETYKYKHRERKREGSIGKGRWSGKHYVYSLILHNSSGFYSCYAMKYEDNENLCIEYVYRMCRLVYVCVTHSYIYKHKDGKTHSLYIYLSVYITICLCLFTRLHISINQSCSLSFSLPISPCTLICLAYTSTSVYLRLNLTPHFSEFNILHFILRC